MAGLSPRVRGNHPGRDFAGQPDGSIPAGAGEPAAATDSIGISQVYPRGCGGTCTDGPAIRRRHGLSPRVRGNLDAVQIDLVGVGSIPAGAGEPRTAGLPAPSPAVYPRGCGGTAYERIDPRWLTGLSPRVRGNDPVPPRRPWQRGSIPAGAGEPALGRRTRPSQKVYPRGCGGTSKSSRRAAASEGLSPRVRGNREGLPERGLVVGSIPAGAGEPSTSRARSRSRRVYPRGCGGTDAGPRWLESRVGLSPRVRGNRRRRRPRPGRPGSIPAGAGEPQWPAGHGYDDEVYPRGCGGTGKVSLTAPTERGLSPRVRGNPDLRLPRVLPPGSIPAGAGEPSSRGGTRC